MVSRARCEDFLARHGAGPTIDPHAFADAWRRRYQPAMEARSGRRPFTRLDVLHRENLDGVLADHGVDFRAARRRTNSIG